MKKNYINMSVVALTFSTLLVGCGSSSKPAKPTFTKQGVWERKGYGSVIKVDKIAKVIKSYEFTRETCLQSTADISDIQTVFDKTKLSKDKNTLTLDGFDDGTLKLNRLEKLPQSCIDDRLIAADTPTNTFKHLWHNFNDYYAFFDERNVDWAAQYLKYEPQVSDDMSKEELFQLISNMLDPIDDSHVELSAGEVSFQPSKDTKLDVAIKQAFSQQDEFDDIDEYTATIYSRYFSIIENNLDENSTQFLTGVNGGKIITTGTIDNTIGYMQINLMNDFVSGDDADNVKAVDVFMKKVMKNLKDTDGMIVDVRQNQGGYALVSLAIASYFTDKKKKVYSRKAKYSDGETEEIDTYIEPAQSPYLKPVVVIAGEETVSAGENFLMAMDVLPNVKLIGENSNGALSSNLFKDLPNGWEVSLSNEVYYDLSGKKVEVVAIAPDINVSVFSAEALVEGRDDALETALQLLN